MRNVVTALFLASICGSSALAYASNPAKDAAFKMFKLKSPPQSRLKDPNTCTDFSGTWSGQCVDGAGSVSASTITIDQSRCLVQMGGLTLSLWESSGTVSPWQNTHGEDALKWNADQTQLMQLSSFVGNWLPSDYVAVISTSQYKIDNGQLVVTTATRGTRIDDSITDQVNTTTCTYSTRQAKR